MNKTQLIDDLWLKSSVLGSLWASSEIILGSFLHNLRFPFSGYFLTGIGIIILVSVSYLWNEKGLFWRSGIICAVMKTMSPSAVIFGPMIAIIAEAFLLEGSTRIFGRNYFGFIVGASLAMLWTLFQKLVNFIIFYGFDIVELYENILIYTQKQFNIQFDIIWLPIILFALIGIFIGLFATLIGIRTGKKALKTKNDYNFSNFNRDNFLNKNSNQHEFNYSIIILILNILFIVSILILMNFSEWYFWICSGFLVIIFWILRYKRAFSQFKKPKFWLLFVIITILSALVFSKLLDSSNSWLQGLFIGLEMNFRATVMILGFTAIGTELYNPKIREYFSKSYFKKLHQSLEIAFDTLPVVISGTPDFRHFFKQKYSITNHIVNQAEHQFFKIRQNLSESSEIIIISGKINEGKTDFLKRFMSEITSGKIKTGGFISQKYFENNTFNGYDLLNLKNNKLFRLARLKEFENSLPFRKYFFDKKTLEQGNKILNSAVFDSCELIIIDEIGMWEIENGGWLNGLNNLISNTNKKIIMTVRTEFIDLIIDKFQLKNYKIFDIANCEIESVEDYIKTSKNEK